MTYPPQGGYGPQQQGGGYGYPPQQPGYPPPQPGGYGPYPPYPPPQKNNTGLIVGIAAAVVVVVVGIVLVFVLTGDDDNDTAGGTGTESSQDGGGGLPGKLPGDDSDSGSDSGNDGGNDGGDSGSSDGASSPQELANKTVEIIETQDEGMVDQYSCTSNEADQLKDELAKLPSSGVSATVEAISDSGDTAQAAIEVRAGGETQRFTVEMEKQGDSWCASGI